MKRALFKTSYTVSDVKKNFELISRHVNNLDNEKGSLTRKTMKTKPKAKYSYKMPFSLGLSRKELLNGLLFMHPSDPLLCYISIIRIIEYPDRP